MKEKFKSLKNFNWRLFASLCALALIPAVYQTVRTFIISSNGESGVFDRSEERRVGKECRL